jgi:hypothetical protein
MVWGDLALSPLESSGDRSFLTETGKTKNYNRKKGLLTSARPAGSGSVSMD